MKAKYDKLLGDLREDDSGGGFIDITYAELVALIGTSGLTCGSFYRITDFATAHWMVDVTIGGEISYNYILDGEGNKIIHTGANEPLLVLATSANTISTDAWSALYPDDILSYDWNSQNYSNIKSFWDSDLSESPVGFKGIITRREDTINALKTNFDFREITYRLYSIEQTAWNSETIYAGGEYVQNGTIIYYANAGGSTDVEPGVDTGWETYWTVIIDITDNVFLSYSFTSFFVGSYNLLILDTEDYIDRTMFDVDCINIMFDECKMLPYMTYGSNCYGMTYGSGCCVMTYGSYCYTMTYGSNCYGMTYGSYCYGMTYGSGCYNLTFPDCCVNNNFKDGVNNYDYTDSTQITDGSNVTHQLSGATIYQTYIDDSSTPEIIITTDTIGVTAP
jgi:hypothetical protein